MSMNEMLDFLGLMPCAGLLLVEIGKADDSGENQFLKFEVNFATPTHNPPAAAWMGLWRRLHTDLADGLRKDFQIHMPMNPPVAKEDMGELDKSLEWTDSRGRAWGLTLVTLELNEPGTTQN